MRRFGMAALAALVLWGVSGPGQARDAAPEQVQVPFLGGFLEHTRVLYPLRLGDWEAVREHRYEQREYGVSVRYVSEAEEAAWLDVYFYPAGVLDGDQLVAWAAREFEDAIGARIQQGQQAQPVTAMDAFAIEGVAHAFKGSMVFEGDDGAIASAMGLAHHELYFVKARLSRPMAAGGVEGVEQLMEQVMVALLPRLRIISTGWCWEARSTEEATLVHPGNTEVLGPHPGCAGRDPFEPEVPETHREIRIEYL